MLKPLQLWINALRSGEYKQTTGSLRRLEGGFCCLGVACDLYKQHVGGRWVGPAGFDSGGGNNVGFMPDRVAEWLGIDPGHKRDSFQHRLVTENDFHCTKFPVIADMIEQEYLNA